MCMAVLLRGLGVTQDAGSVSAQLSPCFPHRTAARSPINEAHAI